MGFDEALASSRTNALRFPGMAFDVLHQCPVVDVAKSDRKLTEQSRIPGSLRKQDVIDLPGLHGIDFDQELADLFGP